ncbi:MAG TPA: DUF6191 domain-containing protein [Microlunatus sp.]|jgi:hypothetical protein|nr:DUF6191 domain-containing protein [Microlunatus sp.]
MSFMEIFQPGLKHLREERERQRMNVAYPTDGADPLMEIDLDAGTATIRIPTADRAPEMDSTSQTATGSTDSDRAAGSSDSTASERPESSADHHTGPDRTTGRPPTH